MMGYGDSEHKTAGIHMRHLTAVFFFFRGWAFVRVEARLRKQEEVGNVIAIWQ